MVAWIVLTPGLLVMAFGGSERAHAKTDLEKIQGTWVVVGGEEKGKRIREEEAKTEAMSFIFKGNAVIVVRNKKKQRVQFKLDPSKHPAWIDFIEVAGEDRGEKNHAIYALKNNKLIICVSKKFGYNSPMERPTKFTTKKGSNGGVGGLVLFICERKDRLGTR